MPYARRSSGLYTILHTGLRRAWKLARFSSTHTRTIGWISFHRIQCAHVSSHSKIWSRVCTIKYYVSARQPNVDTNSKESIKGYVSKLCLRQKFCRSSLELGGRWGAVPFISLCIQPKPFADDGFQVLSRATWRTNLPQTFLSGCSIILYRWRWQCFADLWRWWVARFWFPVDSGSFRYW